MAKLKYSPTLPGQMYCFFRGYDDSGAPSFVKFAASVGATTEQLENFRKHKEFERAYRECCEIKRDYLIDRALSRRFDPTFVKFLFSSEEEKDTSSDSESFTLHLTVTE